MLQIERLIQASGSKTCQEMLVHSAAKHIMENHIWFSIFFKSHRSRYSRVERTSTAFALLFLAMLADAMWYGVMPEQETGGGIGLAFINFTPEQLYIGFMVSLVTIIPAFVIMFLFKKSRRMKLRKNRVIKALFGTPEPQEISVLAQPESKDIEDNENSDESGVESEGSSGDSEGSDNESESSGAAAEDSDDDSKVSENDSKGSDNDSDGSDNEAKGSDDDSEHSDIESKSSEIQTKASVNNSEGSDDESESNSENSDGTKISENSDTEDENEAKKIEVKTDTKIEIETSKSKQYRHFGLPFIFRIIAWILCAVSIVASCIFLVAYGITFGNDVTHQWLTSMIVAFFVMILIIGQVSR